MHEWKYTGGTLYFSVYGLAVDTAASGPADGRVADRAAADVSASASACASVCAANDASNASTLGLSGDNLSYLLHPPTPGPAHGHGHGHGHGPTTSFLQSGPPPPLHALLLLALHDAAAYQPDGAKARQEIFQDAFRDVDGAGLSLRDRTRLALDEPSFSYGEIEYVSFQQLLRDAGAGDGQVFYDLGSGVGKVRYPTSVRPFVASHDPPVCTHTY